MSGSWLKVSTPLLVIKAWRNTMHVSVHQPSFQQLAYRDLKVSKRLIVLIPMQCSPSFDCNWVKQNDPTVCWHQHSIALTYKQKCLTYIPDCVSGQSGELFSLLFDNQTAGRVWSRLTLHRVLIHQILHSNQTTVYHYPANVLFYLD